jgi:hypothetical protein
MIEMIHVFEGVAADTPLLTYALLPFPNPLAASGPAQLTLVVSNSTAQFVTVTSIAVTLPIGTTAKTLTPSANGIGTVMPTTWNATQNGGIFTLTPSTPDAGKIGPNGLSFVFTGITDNDQPGTCTVTLTEQASAPGKGPATRTTGIAVAKFPATFALSDLTVTPPSVTAGGSAVLLWNGSPATYVMQYDPDGNGTQSFPVGASGPYTAPNLTATVVVFTLTATVTVPGQDAPLTIQRQAVVTVVSGSVQFSALPSIVGKNGVTRLTWTTSGTTSRTLDPGGKTVAAIGYAYAIVNATTVFTLRATVSGRAPIVAQQTVTVDPSIVATETLISILGQDGTPGTDAPSGGFSGARGGNGGGGGENASFTGTIGPLDPSSNPARVGYLLVRGGRGGKGGTGGTPRDSGEETGPAGPGGNGGKGGDTVGSIVLTFDPTQPPRQLIVDVIPGAGGARGIGGTSPTTGKAADGDPGQDGKVTATVRFAELSS